MVSRLQNMFSRPVLIAVLRAQTCLQEKNVVGKLHLKMGSMETTFSPMSRWNFRFSINDMSIEKEKVDNPENLFVPVFNHNNFCLMKRWKHH